MRVVRAYYQKIEGVNIPRLVRMPSVSPESEMSLVLPPRSLRKHLFLARAYGTAKILRALLYGVHIRARFRFWKLDCITFAHGPMEAFTRHNPARFCRFLQSPQKARLYVATTQFGWILGLCVDSAQPSLLELWQLQSDFLVFTDGGCSTCYGSF